MKMIKTKTTVIYLFISMFLTTQARSQPDVCTEHKQKKTGTCGWQVKEEKGKNVTEVTYFVSSGT